MRKVQKVKHDKKLVRDMIANGLPGKPQYPVFTAIVGLCLTLAIEETKEDEDVIASAPTVPAKATETDVAPLYTGNGAFMDSPVGFVDLEANLHHSDNSSGRGSDSGSAGAKGKKRGKASRKRQKEKHQQAVAAVDPTANTVDRTETIERSVEVSDISDASGISD